MNGETLARISQVLEPIIAALSRLKGAGYWLFIAGLAILGIVGLILLVKLIVVVIRIIPNLTVSQFVKLLIITAVILIIAGLLI
ncbi:MAG: hypothetical protein LM554_00990 [Desulfurococcaceae archaeon]|jgi:hypothetical protein|nr:hypothetical protein [Desulfurococcaceae archaeon]